MKLIKKYSITFYLFFLFMLIFNVAVVKADEIEIKFRPQVPIPGDSIFTSDGVALSGESGTEWIARYIGAVYRYGISIGAILAAVVIMAAGILWLTSGGSQQKIGKAKELITGSLVGLFLLFGSYMILNMINPALVNFRVSKISAIPPLISGCCKYSNFAEMTYSVICEDKEINTAEEVGIFYSDRVVDNAGNSCDKANCCFSHSFRAHRITGKLTSGEMKYYWSDQCHANRKPGTDLSYGFRSGTAHNENSCSRSTVNCVGRPDGFMCINNARNHWSVVAINCNRNEGLCAWCVNEVCTPKWETSLGGFCGTPGQPGRCTDGCKDNERKLNIIEGRPCGGSWICCVPK